MGGSGSGLARAGAAARTAARASATERVLRRGTRLGLPKGAALLLKAFRRPPNQRRTMAATRGRSKARGIAFENFGCVSGLEDFYAALSMGSGERCGGRISVDLCGFEGSTNR